MHDVDADETPTATLPTPGRLRAMTMTLAAAEQRAALDRTDLAAARAELAEALEALERAELRSLRLESERNHYRAALAWIAGDDPERRLVGEQIARGLARRDKARPGACPAA